MLWLSNLFGVESIKEQKLKSFFVVFFSLLAVGFFIMTTSQHRLVFYIGSLLSICFLIKYKVEGYADYWLIVKRNRIALSSLCFLVYMLLSLVWSTPEDLDSTIRGLKVIMFIIIFSLIVLFSSIHYPDLYHVFIKGFILAAAIISPLLIVNYFLIEGHTAIRLSGIGRSDNPILLGLYFGLALLLLLFPDKEIKRFFNGKLKWVLLFSIFVAFLLSTSRGPILSAFLIFLMFSILHKKYKTLLVIMIAGLSALLVIYFSDVIPTSFFERASSGRLGIWAQALDLIMQKPLIGHGSITRFYYDVTYMEKFYENHATHAHSLYLSTLIQGGLIGLFLLFSVYFFAFKAAIEALKKDGSCSFLILLMAGIILGLTDFNGVYVNLGPEWLVFWLPIFVLIYDQANRKIADNKSKN